MPARKRDSRIKPSPKDSYQLAARKYYSLQIGKEIFEIWINDVLVEGFGPDIVLAFQNKFGRRMGINLSEMTEVELGSLKEFIDRAFELVEPIVKGRDTRANELHKSAGTAFERLYRILPHLVVKPGASELDGESLLLRPVDDVDSEQPRDGNKG